MQTYAKKNANHMLKHAQNMHQICKKKNAQNIPYINFNMENMHKIFMNMQKKCRKYAENMLNMPESM